MDKKEYSTPTTDVLTAYAHLMQNAINDGNASVYVHTSNGTIEYDHIDDKSEGGDDAIVDAKTGWDDTWGDTWTSGKYDPWN